MINGMAPDECIVLLSIAYQRINFESKNTHDIFKYDDSYIPKATHDYKSNRPITITQSRLYEILKSFAPRKDIELDYVEYHEDANKVHLNWNQGYEWSCSMGEIARYYNGYYIHLTNDDAQEIINACARTHYAELILDDQFFVVKYDGNNYQIKPVISSADTYDIIKYAMKKENIGKPVAKNSIRKDLNKDRLYKASLTDVFRKNTTVNKTLASFITVNPKSIQIMPYAWLTTNELNAIIQASR